MLFAVNAKLRLANIKLSELLQSLLILASCENNIFFKTFLLMQEYQLVKLLTLKLKSHNQMKCLNLILHEESLKEKLQEFDLKMGYEGTMNTSALVA